MPYFKQSAKQKTANSYWQAGFTLLEILITIVIIGVVFGIIISSSNAATTRAKDTQRQADVRNLQSALQQYYSDMNYYPENTFILKTATELTSDTGNSGTRPSPKKTYLSSNNFPYDPNNTNAPYCYFAYTSSDKSNPNCDNSASATACQYYEISAKLESVAGGASVSCNGVSVNYNLTVTPN